MLRPIHAAMIWAPALAILALFSLAGCSDGGGRSNEAIGQATQPLSVFATSCGASFGNPDGPEPCTVTITQVDDNNITYAISQPVVDHEAVDYPMITFQPGDRIQIEAGGCVQTGGVGLTWKRYVDPRGHNAGEFYFGKITIPGVTQLQDVAFRDLPAGATFVVADLSSNTCKLPATFPLRLGYPDDEPDDNGYYRHDDGNEDQCAGPDGGPAHILLRVEHGIPWPWPESQDFDLVPACLDDQFLFLNARWGWETPGQVVEYDPDHFQAFHATTYYPPPGSSLL